MSFFLDFPNIRFEKDAHSHLSTYTLNLRLPTSICRIADVEIINGFNRYLSGQIIADLVRLGFDTRFWDYHKKPAS